jgi:hypothetical protein
MLILLTTSLLLKITVLTDISFLCDTDVLLMFYFSGHEIFMLFEVHAVKSCGVFYVNAFTSK